MRANGSIIKSMALALTFGRMVANTTDNGSTTIWRASEFTFMRTACATTVNTTTIRRRDTDSTSGLMVAHTKAGGIRASSTAWAPISTEINRRRSSDYGNTESA